MYYGFKVFLAGVGCFLALSLALPAESRAALGQSTAVRADLYCYKINGAGMKIYVDHNAAGAICEPPPRLDGIWPDAGPLSGGQWFYLWGVNFKEGAEVLFNGTPCIHPIDYYLYSQYGDYDYIVCSTPARQTAGAVDVVVQNPSGVKSNAVTYTYFESQVVISISPISGPSSGGTQVIVTGKGFGDWTYYPVFSGSGGYAYCNNMALIDSQHFTCTTSQVYGSSCGGDTKMDFYVYDMRDGSQNALYGAFTFISPKLFAKGTGTLTDPFIVGTRDELDKVRQCPTMAFAQTADIDIGSTCNSFEPIPYFSGSYDGRGSSILNFCYRDTLRSYLGLIAYNYGRLSNIVLADPVVEGRDVATFQYMGVGTLAGYNSGPVTSCTVINPSVKAGNLTGGMIGFNYGPISQSHVIGANIDGRVWYIGGMAGVSFGSITDSSSSGKVVGLQIIGGLVGSQRNSSIVRSSSSAIATSYPVDGYGIGQKFYDGTGNAGGLTGNLSSARVTDSYATGPVDGGFCIGGLTGGSGNSNISNSYATGTVTGHAIWGDDGGLAGCISGGSIANSFATGDVLLSTDGNYYGWSRSVGGLVGAGMGGTIMDSFATGRVEGGTCIGGLLGGDNSCGWGGGSPKVLRSFALGDVKGYAAVGGLAGFLGWGLDARITDSYSMGSVTGSGPYIGGLIGQNYGTVSTSYSTAASVTGTSDTNGSIGLNFGIVSGVYFFDNGVVPPDLLATPLSASQITDSASFTGFDFTTPVWRMPSANSGASLLSPVLAFQCGKNGVVCQ